MKSIVEFLINSKSTGIIKQNIKYVDLGLGVQWCTCNLGANSPEEFGNYYQWGNLTPNPENCNFENADYNAIDVIDIDRKMVDDKYNQVIKECGYGYTIPTKYYFEDLLDNTDITEEQLNDVHGYLFTSIINKNSIFIPSGGYKRDNTILKNEFCSLLWMSETDKKLSPYYILLKQGEIEDKSNLISSTSYYWGLNIRPVKY